MKVIAFSLWGESPKYNKGAIHNAHLALKYYPGWRCRFYLGKSVPKDTIDALSQFSHVDICHMDYWDDWRGMYWRFFPASDPDVDIMLSRDCDSRLSERERAAVAEFEQSPYIFHSMRDNPNHGIGILGGMWGAKKGAVPNMRELIDEHIKDDNRWGIDQDFLCSIIEPTVRPNWIEHDSFFNVDKRDDQKRAFPTPRDRKSMFYVGQPFDANNNPELPLVSVGHD